MFSSLVGWWLAVSEQLGKSDSNSAINPAKAVMFEPRNKLEPEKTSGSLHWVCSWYTQDELI